MQIEEVKEKCVVYKQQSLHDFFTDKNILPVSKKRKVVDDENVIIDESITNKIFIDVETNGIGSFNPANQRVVQVGWLFGEKKGSFFINDVLKVSPTVPHPYNVAYLKEHGIDFDDGIYEFFMDLRKSDGIVAHNAQFDVGCILNELRLRKDSNNILYTEIEEEMKKKPILDTMLETVEICKIEFKSGFGYKTKYKYPKLEELYIHCFFKKPILILHDAVNDCIITRDCLNFLIKKNMLKCK
jgi:DNA polymerase III epsilon subunit-like protein